MNNQETDMTQNSNANTKAGGQSELPESNGSLSVCCGKEMGLFYMAAHGIAGAIMNGSEHLKCKTCGNEKPFFPYGEYGRV